MKIVCKDFKLKDFQESFNLKLMLYLNNKGLEYTNLKPPQRHKALFKIISSCNECKNFRQGFIAPKYVEKPSLVFISRSSTKKDLKYGDLLDISNPQTSIIKDICDIFNTAIQEIYFTNTAFCITKSPNEITSTMCQRCHRYKDLELDTIELPKVIFLLGNDALNSFFNLDCTVNHILGNIYYTYYKGDYRLFIPIPHPVNLLRDKQLYETTMKFVSIIKQSIDNNLMEAIQNACNKQQEQSFNFK